MPKTAQKRIEMMESQATNAPAGEGSSMGSKPWITAATTERVAVIVAKAQLPSLKSLDGGCRKSVAYVPKTISPRMNWRNRIGRFILEFLSNLGTSEPKHFFDAIFLL